jgi:hypothetical protein
MQLPRGTFREIKKAVLISSLLEELERTKFTGICNISSDPASGTLVFKSGKCILAKILKKSGDGAWEELQKIGNHEIDAALSNLDEAQVQLALEFNKPSRMINTGKTAPAAALHREPAGKQDVVQSRTAEPVKPAAAHLRPSPPASPNLRPSSSFTAPPAPALSKPFTPPTPARTAVSPPTAVPVRPVIQPPAQPLTTQKPAAPAYGPPQIPVHHKQEQKKPAESEEVSRDSSSFEKDIDTFDTLDLDNVTDKIRNDCKTMIKQLQLEHLMER